MTVIQEFKAQIQDMKEGAQAIIGEGIFNLSSIIGVYSGLSAIDVKKNNHTAGFLSIRCNRALKEMSFFNFQIKGIGLNNFGLFNTLDPLIKLWKPKVSPEQVKEIAEGKLDPEKHAWKDWITIWQGQGEGKNILFNACQLGTIYMCHGFHNLPLRVSKFRKKLA